MKTFGLTTNQALENRKKGTNELSQREPASFFEMFKETLEDEWLKILMVALALEILFFIIGKIVPGLGSTDWYTPVSIFLAIAISSLVTTYTNYKQDRGARALQQEANNITVKVYRDGELAEMSINDIVLEDCVYLQAGDKVPADGILLDGSLKIDQSAVNGESEESEKLVLGDRPVPDSSDTYTKYKCFRGTVVTSGAAVMKVTEVGDATVLGKINQSLQEKDDAPTPSEEKMARLANYIGIFGYVAGAISMVLGLMLDFKKESGYSMLSTILWTVIGFAIASFCTVVSHKILQPLREKIPEVETTRYKDGAKEFFATSFKSLGFKALKGSTFGIQLAVAFIVFSGMITKFMGINFLSSAYITLSCVIYAVSIVVMAVPEGLPTMNTLVQSMNVGKMKKANIFVKNPKSIETAGYLTQLFTDKTGTLTKGVMQVSNIITGDAKVIENFMELDSNVRDEIVIGAGVNNEAVIDKDKKAVGSTSTDRALMNYFEGLNIKVDNSLVKSREGFNSKVKYASVTMNSGDRYIKGAPDVIIKGCDYYVGPWGIETEFSEDAKKKLEEAWFQQTNRAMRVIACVKETADGKKVFICLISIRDNARQEVKPTVEVLKNAGVGLTMVTGDLISTATAIAKEIGLVKTDEDICITHEELDRMSDERILEILPRLKVVARAVPSDKERLVRIARSAGEVVGMTGDGINDASALHKADVGFAMGDGTEVAKEAGDIIIQNNSLTSIADAIKYGRTMSKSVKKFLIFQLTVNVSTVFTAILGMILGWRTIFLTIQVMWINMIMDNLAAIALGQEAARDSYMCEKPISRKAEVLNGYVKTSIVTSGIFITIICLAILENLFGIHSLIGSTDADVIRTFMFATFIMTVIFNSLNVRTESFKLFEHIKENKSFIIVMSCVTLIQVLIIQMGGKVFGTVPLSLKNWLLVVLIAFLIIPIDMIRKFVIKRMGFVE